MNDHLNILVVDDEEVILTIFREYFESFSNHTVLTAGNGLEALETIKKEEIDCCFTDLSMPKLDGVELIKRIHHYDNTIPVVVMTGYPSMDNAIKTLKSGVVDFLTKPIKMNQLSITVERVMRERALFTNNILLKEEAKKNNKLLKINKELQQKIKEVETMNLILQQLDQVTTSKDLFDVLVNLSGEVTKCDETHFCIFAQDTADPAIITSFFRDGKETTRPSNGIEKNIIKKVAEEGMPFLVKGNNGDGSIMAIPLKIKSMVFGILVSLIKDKNTNFTEKDLYFLNFLSEKASFLIENLALYENIYENLFSTLYAFVETIEARDSYTKQHSSRVTSYAVAIAKAVGCSQEEIDVLNVSGNLHDIGKIGIPDNILLKPGRLSESEYEFIKKHPIIGCNIIGHFNMWVYEQDVIKHHHERWDGEGYPDRLQGEDIPLLSRVLAVADTYDALTSDRSYRRKMQDDVAFKIIQENSGSQFDPKIAGAFLKLYEQGMIVS